jgi:hypothetical protein
MSKNIKHKYLKNISPAIYRISVQGNLDEIWSERLSGMQITTSGEENSDAVTLLFGRVKDQAELNGILETLYTLQRSVLSVECLEKL